MRTRKVNWREAECCANCKFQTVHEHIIGTLYCEDGKGDITNANYICDHYVNKREDSMNEQEPININVETNVTSNGYIFGVNVVPEWEEGDKLYIFIDEKSVWDEEKEYSGEIEEELYYKLRDIGIDQDSETVFSRPEKMYVGVKNIPGGYKDNPFMTRQEIADKLIELGFEYNADFEKECVELRYP